ncbi:MAG: ATP-binding cassette domain-containing protein [Candidatus Aenigmatarchaeota archaeon]
MNPKIGSILSMSMIKIKDLTKKFNGLTAVDSINLEIEEGELFGLLGPNGAGKTTTISMLATIVKPTTGTAEVNNFDLKEQDKIRRSIGIVFQDPSLDDELTGRENLEFHGRMYHMPSKLRKQRIEEVLNLVDLSDKANVIVKTYSGGMKRRLEIARGLMHHPKILFLDEPTLGLDPQTRRKIWEYIENLNKKEKLTIILTTHYMEEADYLCNRIAIIDHGKMVALDKPENLKNVIGGDLVILETKETEKVKKLLEVMKLDYKEKENTFTIKTKNAEKLIPEILAAASKDKIIVDSVNLKRPNLEDVFIHYTGHAIREQEASDVDNMRMRMKAGFRR